MTNAVGRRYGVASVLAMFFLAITAALAIAMIGLARTNSQIVMNQDNAERALASAEAGLRFISWKFSNVQLPTTSIGVVDSATANTLWTQSGTGIMASVIADLSGVSTSVIEKKEILTSTTLHVGKVYVVDQGANSNIATFDVTAAPDPTRGDARVLLVKSTGTCGGVSRTIQANFLIYKTFQHAILTKIPIQLGKNTVVEGDIYMACANNKGATIPPVLSVSDFRYTSGTTSDALTTKIQAFEDFLKSKTGSTPNYTGTDNRVDATDTATITKLKASNSALANISDYNGDNHIDEFDLFLQQFDTNASHGVSKSEYLGVAPNDPNLFYVIDRGIGKPITATEIANPRPGYADDFVDYLDPYAKVKGTIRLWDQDQATLAARLGVAVSDLMQGVFISRDGYSAAVLYNQQADPATAITPASFNMAAFLDLAGTNAGTSVAPSTVPEPDPTYSALSTKEYANKTITASAIVNGTCDTTLINQMLASVASGGGGDTNPVYTTKTVVSRDANGNPILDSKGKPVTKQVSALTSVTENVPYGSQSPRSSVTRPVISGMNFKNCVINRGSNALFLNCTFDGVTFVDGAYTMAQSTSDYSKGNNLRFQGCTFTGPVVQGDATATGSNRGAGPTNYTDYTNSWEFTGATTIDLRSTSDGGPGSKDGSADSTALAAIKQQATIMAPQTNIEMGSYTDPASSKCSFQGIVVAGCFDVRGVADIDGSIIVPSTAAGNVTLGYFGSNDNATSQGEPDPYLTNSGNGSFGRVHIRFNPLRTLPNGINLCVSVYPDITSIREVTQ